MSRQPADCLGLPVPAIAVGGRTPPRSVKVVELARMLKVSDMTIRRDLDVLAEQGFTALQGRVGVTALLTGGQLDPLRELTVTS